MIVVHHYIKTGSNWQICQTNNEQTKQKTNEQKPILCSMKCIHLRSFFCWMKWKSTHSWFIYAKQCMAFAISRYIVIHYINDNGNVNEWILSGYGYIAATQIEFIQRIHCGPQFYLLSFSFAFCCWYFALFIVRQRFT